jgi:hypothetical protein
LRIKNVIVKAMKKGEVTLMHESIPTAIIPPGEPPEFDFSKKNTVKFPTVRAKPIVKFPTARAKAY